MRVEMSGSEWFSSRPGGLNRYFQDLFLALREDPGFEVEARAFGEPPSGGLAWSTGRGTLGRMRASRTVSSDAAPVILDRHFCLYGPPLGRPRFRRGRIEVMHFHGPWAEESRIAGGSAGSVALKRLIELERYSRIDQFVVLSSSFRALLTERYRVHPDRVSVIPPGVDLSRFRADGGDGREPRVLCVRRLERRMGIDVLLDGWTRVIDAIPAARLDIVGTGSQEAELRRRANALGIDRSVSFRGRLSDLDLAAAYHRSMLSVVPSLALEGFGLIAIESLACGTPAVVTDVGGLPDVIAPFDPSLVVAAGDRAALARRIILGLRGSLPSAADCRRHARHYSWHDAARAHLALYRRLLKTKAA